VALSTRHRSSIFQALSPIIGEEEAEAMLSQFPARDLDEPVTKEFVRAEIAGVRAEIADLRGELHTEIAGVRAEIADLRGELHTEIAGVRAEIADLRGELHTEIAGVRAEIAHLEARINDRFREQTMWMAGAMTVGMGLAAGIGSLLG
jgi:chromosome segregation ATPase